MKRNYGAFLLVLLIVISACGIDNTMYNAKNYFESAQERPLNANGRPTPQAVSDYTKAIQKCGIILSDGGKSKRADEALFLMAKALYYKKNSAFQAKEAFENLIRGYPQSKHVPEAYIYLAQVLREINQNDEAEAVLQRFIRDPKYVKHHPRALLTLADFEIQDENYSRAQFWLERIITDYRKTNEFKEAFFLFGKNYYMQGEYERSLAQFETFVKTRGIPKDKKLEARYYIALNHLELGELETALQECRYLVRNEVRPDMLSRARVLYGRALLANSKEEDGLRELEEVTSTYPRTETAAEAYYYWGNYLYYHKHDLELSVTHLNRVRTEYSNSALAEIASKKATAISQTKLAASLNSRQDLQSWLDHHYLRAERFISPLALPDSALATYQRVIEERDSLSTIRDSLLQEIEYLSVRIDSLNTAAEDTTSTLVPDSEAEAADLVPPDSLAVLSEMTDAEPITQDVEIPIADSLKQAEEDEQGRINADNAEQELRTAESLEEEENSEEPPPEPELSQQDMEQLIVNLQQEVAEIEPLLQRFDSEIIPYSYFSMYNILYQAPERSQEATELYNKLLTEYPHHMYSAAATALKEGKVPHLIDPAYEEATSAFDAALDYYPEAPDSLVTAMQEFIQSDYEDLRLRANYRLGWHYSFEEPDTTLAKTYLKEVLAAPEQSEYQETVRRFFDGENYLLRDSGIVDSTLVEVDSLQISVEQDETAEADSTFVGPPEMSDTAEDEESWLDFPQLKIQDELIDTNEINPQAEADSLSEREPEPAVNTEDAQTEDSQNNPPPDQPEAEAPAPLPSLPE